MKVPFTPEQFMGVFEHYNLDIWPLQVVAYVLGLVALALAWRQPRYSGRLVSAILALFWLWNGVVFHIVYSSPINPAAIVFGGLFVVQGVLLIAVGVAQPRLSFRARTDWVSLLGGLLVLYALVLYPILGMLSGHSFPRAPLFGVAPCPTVIFTFGLFLWTDAKLPRYLLVVPFLWSLLGSNAALPPFNIREDFGLLASGLLGTALVALRVGKQTLQRRVRQSYA
jgi:hypothetical protein